MRTITIRAEIRKWQLSDRRKGRMGRQSTIKGLIFNDAKGVYIDGEEITFQDVSVSDYLGRFLIGVGYGTEREYFEAYSITRDD